MTVAPPSDQPPSLVVSIISSLLRHTLTGLGAWLISAGLITSSQSGSLVEWGVGGASIIASLLWSALEKKTKISQITTLIGSSK